MLVRRGQRQAGHAGLVRRSARERSTSVQRLGIGLDESDALLLALQRSPRLEGLVDGDDSNVQRVMKLTCVAHLTRGKDDMYGRNEKAVLTRPIVRRCPIGKSRVCLPTDDPD